MLSVSRAGMGYNNLKNVEMACNVYSGFTS